MTATDPTQETDTFADMVGAEDEVIRVVDGVPDDVEVEVEHAHKTRPPLWPFLVLGGALLGFGASFAATHYTRPDPVDVSALEAEVATLRSQFSALQSEREAQPDVTAQIAALQSRVAGIADRPVTAAAATMDTSELEARLDALEAREVPAIDEALVARLEAVQADGLPVGLSDIEAMQGRIEELDERLVRQEDARASSLANATELEALRREVEALRAQVDAGATAKPGTVMPTLTDPAMLPAFPADRLREGAAEAAGEGFLRRSLSRHVRIKDEGSAEVLIGEVEAALAEGDAAAAVAAFDQLPDGLRSLARAWRAEMEGYLP